MVSVTWLHISDLHFRNCSYDSDKVLSRLLDDIKERIRNDNLKPDFIILSGDISYSGKPEEFDLAAKFLNEILAISQLERDCLFVVPGNHDADRSKISPLCEKVADLIKDNDTLNSYLSNTDERSLLFRRMQNYNEFIEKFFENDQFHDHYIKTIPLRGLTIKVLCLNSSLLGGSNKDRHNLILEESQIDSLLTEAKGASIRIALMHHPLDWLKDFNRSSIEALLFQSCDFILHGHMHINDLRQISTPDANSITIAAGACYEQRTMDNSYNIVKLDLDKLEGEIHFRRYSNSQAGFWTNDTITYKNAKNGLYRFNLNKHLQQIHLNSSLANTKKEGHSNEETKVSQYITEHKFNIPNLPKPYYAHFFNQYPNFTGRILERQMLSEWISNDKNSIISLISIGGMGKSSLIWYWLNNDVDKSLFDGILWWSFYDNESSFTKFLDEAIVYISNGTENPYNISLNYKKSKLLIDLLGSRKFLIIFDGFERQLGMYDTLKEYDENIEEDIYYVRSCIDPKASHFLCGIASGISRSKLIITSRAIIRDLEDHVGNPFDGCRKEILNSLDPSDAIAFMRLQGINKGSDIEIDNACKTYGYHPLSLRLLSGLVARNKRKPGDISIAPSYDEHIDLRSARKHILETTFNALPDGYQRLLSRIASLRSTSSYDIIELFNDFKSLDKFEVALDELIGWGMLLFDKEKRRFDLHPIVRKYAYSRLSDKIRIHSSIRDYFIAKLPPEKIYSIDNLDQTVNLYYHTARSKMFDEASQIYIKELFVPLYYRFGAYLTSIELLKELFSDENDEPQLKNNKDKRVIINALGMSYYNFGYTSLALDVFKHDVYIADRFCDKSSQIDSRLCLSLQYLKLGQLSNAIKTVRTKIKGKSSLYDEGILRAHYGEVLAYMGAFTKSAFEINKSLGIFIKLNLLQAQCCSYQTRSRLRLFMKRPEDAFNDANLAAKLWLKCAKNDDQFERDRIVNEWLLGSSLTQMAITDLQRRSDLLLKAEPHLDEALARCRSINLVVSEPDILTAWSRWHLINNNINQAEIYANEALQISERCDYRINMAEIHNILSIIALNNKDLERAVLHAQRSYDFGLCDGNQYCYKPALMNSENLLKMYKKMRNK